MPCTNCNEFASDHQNGKCLFAATTYAPCAPEDFQHFIEQKYKLVTTDSQTMECDIVENGVLYRTTLGPGFRRDVPKWVVVDDPIRIGELEAQRQQRWHEAQNNPNVTFFPGGYNVKS